MWLPVAHRQDDSIVKPDRAEWLHATLKRQSLGLSRPLFLLPVGLPVIFLEPPRGPNRIIPPPRNQTPSPHLGLAGGHLEVLGDH